jgi:hypothetical protein
MASDDVAKAVARISVGTPVNGTWRTRWLSDDSLETGTGSTYEFTSRHHPVRKFSDHSENRSKSAVHVYACGCSGSIAGVNLDTA